MSGKVLFGNNLDRLNPNSHNTLMKIAHTLLAVDIDKVRLEGHTDSYGDEDYNQKLSGRRAGSVAAVFREVGMPAANIKIYDLGMSKSVADNKTRAGRSENHHVAIITPTEQSCAHGLHAAYPYLARPSPGPAATPLLAHVEGRSQQTGAPAAATADTRLDAAQGTDNLD